MKRKNRILYLLFLLIGITFLTFCSDKENPVEYDPDALRVPGKYEAVTFEVPTITDGTLDVIGIGGFINLELFPDFSVKGSWNIPETPDLNDSGFEETLEGEFFIKNDSLQFKEMNNILSHPSVYFLIKEDSLNAYYGGGSFPPYVIKLKRNKTS